MLFRLALLLGSLSPWIKRQLWRGWYQYLARQKSPGWRFMNYGYVPLTEDEVEPKLNPEDEPERCAIQMYDGLARAVDLRGLRVLEVGCGRGGGASYIMRYHGPREVIGVDYSRQAVRLCRALHHVEGLSFEQGDAEALPFPDESFDVVLNVESSHCYGSMPLFLSEVKRVLRPGGVFLFADLRGAMDFPWLERQLAESGLTIVDQEDITANVVASLQRDGARRTELIERGFSKPLVGMVQQFCAVEGTGLFENFKNGGAVYYRYLLRKGASVDSSATIPAPDFARKAAFHRSSSAPLQRV